MDKNNEGTVEEEIARYKTLNEAYYREEYPTNKERFAVVKDARERAELEFQKGEYKRLQNLSFSNHDARQSEFVTRQSKHVRNSAMQGFRQSVFDGTMQVRASIMGATQGIVNTIGKVVPKPAADVIKEAREGFIKINKITGPQGEVPIPVGFANTAKYWEMIFWSGLLGGVTGAIGSILINIAVAVPKQWYQCDWDNDVACGYLYRGHWYFVPMVASAGLVIGLYRWYVDYKMDTPILFYELRHYHGNLVTGWHTFFLTGLSMAFGGALGPEMGLCALGIGVSTYLKDYLDLDDEEDGKLLVLCGAVGAFGAIFNNPLCSTLLILEIAAPPKDYMYHTTILAFSAIVSFCVSSPIYQHSFVHSFSDKGIQLALEWTYHEHQIVYAFLVGLVSACVGLLSMFLRIICKQVFVRMRISLAPNKLLMQILPPVCGGAVLGLTMYCLPLTIGYGSLQQVYLIKYASTSQVDMSLLIKTIFFRLLSLGISGTSGFRGGIFVSLVAAGIGCGCVAYRILPGSAPLGLYVGCFFGGVPSALTAMPFMWTTLVCLTFSFSFKQSVTVFLACITSYLFSAGTGLLQAASESQIPFLPMPKPPMPKSPSDTPMVSQTKVVFPVDHSNSQSISNPDRPTKRFLSAISDRSSESESTRSNESESSSNPAKTPGGRLIMDNELDVISEQNNPIARASQEVDNF